MFVFSLPPYAKYNTIYLLSLNIFVKACKLSPLILSIREVVIRGPKVNKRPYWFRRECKKKGVIKASPYAECYSLSSLFLTIVAAGFTGLMIVLTFIVAGIKMATCGGAHGVMVIVVGSEHGDTSSNPRRDWLHSTWH